MTSKCFRKRVNEHRQQPHSVFKKHFSESPMCHSFKCQVIELVRPEFAWSLLLEREQYWINTLEPKLNTLGSNTYKDKLLQLEMESATAEREAKDASKREEEVENEEENTE